jgi:hypothetical protein
LGSLTNFTALIPKKDYRKISKASPRLLNPPSLIQL